MKLTIGMAHYDDFDGAYFTIQDIRKELIFNNYGHLLNEIEFVILDNNPTSKHGEVLKEFSKNNLPDTSNIKYIIEEDTFGTSATRNKVISEATGDFVLVMDCHVMLCPTVGALVTLFNFLDKNKETDHLYSGPLVHDSMMITYTHFNNVWGGGMWGQWGSAFSCKDCEFKFSPVPNGQDQSVKYVSLVEQEYIDKCPSCGLALPEINANQHKRTLQQQWGYEACDNNPEPFEIFAQGLGLFLVRKESWLGFNEHSMGFGGEEGYIHTKYRQNGRKAVCLPFLRWLHRFQRPSGVNYTLSLDNKVRNYILEFTELGLDLQPIMDHFKDFPSEKINKYIEEANSYYR
jgi:glycosyltransferase involved in cell wall biosynthesis